MFVLVCWFCTLEIVLFKNYVFYEVEVFQRASRRRLNSVNLKKTCIFTMDFAPCCRSRKSSGIMKAEEQYEALQKADFTKQRPQKTRQTKGKMK